MRKELGVVMKYEAVELQARTTLVLGGGRVWAEVIGLRDTQITDRG